MKKLSLLFGFVLAVSLASCSKDRSNDNDNNQQLTGLAAFLDGKFNVQAIDVSGNVSAPGGLNAPLDSSGNGGSGFYDFNAGSKRVSYDVTGQIKFSILTQSFDIPVPVQGEGDLEIISETRFTITPENGTPQVCDVVEASGNTLVFTTRTVQDTMNFTFDTTLELFLEKE